MNVNRSDTYITKQFLNFFTMIEILFHIQFSIHIGIMSIEVFAKLCQCMYIFCTRVSSLRWCLFCWCRQISVRCLQNRSLYCGIWNSNYKHPYIKGLFLHYIIITKSFSNFIKHTTFYFNMFSFSEWVISQVRQMFRYRCLW